MPVQWIDPTASQSLVVLVESVVNPMLMEHPRPVCLDLEIDPELEVPSDPPTTVELLRSLVRQSLQELNDGGDITITACETVTGVELEIADTGRDVEHRSHRIPLCAAVIGVELSWQNCPQGGAAVTVKFPRQTKARRHAA